MKSKELWEYVKEFYSWEPFDSDDYEEFHEEDAFQFYVDGDTLWYSGSRIRVKGKTNIKMEFKQHFGKNHFKNYVTWANDEFLRGNNG